MMRINILLFLSIIFLTFSCIKEKDSDIKYYLNGNKKLEIRHINDSTDVFLGYFESGSLRDYTTFVNGKLEGRIMRYFSNGALEEDCLWKNDLRDGPCTTYYESGHLRNISTFEDSITVGNVLEFRNSSKQELEYVGNYSRVKEKSYFNYGTWYDSLGRIKKRTVGIDTILANKIISIHDSLKITFVLQNQIFPRIRAYVSDFDKNYNSENSSKVKTYEGLGNKVTIFVHPKALGLQKVRGFIDSYEYEEKLKKGGYKTKGKMIYWSYDYEVVK